MKHYIHFSTNQASIRTLLFEKDLKLETQILNWIYILFNVFLILSERNILQTNFDGGPGYEVFFYSWIKVRILAEKVQDQPEHHDDRAKKVEFSLPTWLSTVFKCPTLKIRTRNHKFLFYWHKQETFHVRIC